MKVVEVFADVWCPFTHVGLRRLVDERTERGRDDVVFWVRAWPLELVNGAPLAADFVGEEIEALRSTVAEDLFHGFVPSRFPHTTLPALSLVARAYGRGHRTGEAVSLAVRTALFEEGRDIGDPNELATIAKSFDVGATHLDADTTVSDDWHEGQARGVLGSPYFVVDKQGFFCPTLKISHVGDELEVEIDVDAFEAFVATIFDQG